MNWKMRNSPGKSRGIDPKHWLNSEISDSLSLANSLPRQTFLEEMRDVARHNVVALLAIIDKLAFPYSIGIKPGIVRESAPEWTIIVTMPHLFESSIVLRSNARGCNFASSQRIR
jgi:hypothetical protein